MTAAILRNPIFFAVVLLAHNGLRAQPGHLDLRFAPNPGAYGSIYSSVYATAIQPDGKIVIGGFFDTVNYVPHANLARLNDDGSLDTGFQIGSGANARINAIVIQPSDGKIIIGGEFTAYNGTAVNRIARLNADGSIDTTFTPGTGANNTIKCLALQTDGKILIGGSFTSYDNSTKNYVARLETNGTLDVGFNTGSGPNQPVESMAIQPADGKVLIGGSFTLVNGFNLKLRIARLETNGSLDNSFNSANGAGSTVYAIAVQNDGRIIIGGAFTTYGGITRSKIARLNADGSLDGNFDPGSGANGDVHCAALLPNELLLVGGGFTSLYNLDSARIRIGLLTHLGGLDVEFNPLTGTDGVINSISIDRKGRAIIGGGFTRYDTTARHRIARIFTCRIAQPDSIYGNSFAPCSGTPQTYYVTTDPDAVRYEWTLPNGWTGSSDSAFITAVSNGAGGTISVRVFTDSCGWSYAATRTISTIQPAAVPICLVTVDTPSTHNIVIWEKTPTNLIDSFFIYREITSNTYAKIGAVHYDSLSEYHDYAANPNTTSYRYKLSVLDTCGAESALSVFHSTIHLQNLGNGNFQWTFYEIEPGTNPVTSYKVYRDNAGNGIYSQIGFVAGTNSTFTDVNFSQQDSNTTYVVDVNWGIGCDPSRRVSTSRSNIRRMKDFPPPAAICNQLLAAIRIFPNPAENVFNLELPETVKLIRAELFNALGQKIWNESASPFNEAAIRQFNTSALPKGFYTLALETNYGRLMHKIILE